jgi:hypothetical protein
MTATVPDLNRDLLKQQAAIVTVIAPDTPLVETLGAIIALAARLEPGESDGPPADLIIYFELRFSGVGANVRRRPAVATPLWDISRNSPAAHRGPFDFE